MTDEQLRGWKEISAFLGTSPRTAQRWETELGLPVHRVGKGPRAPVHASRAELSAWREAQAAQEETGVPGMPAAERPPMVGVHEQPHGGPGAGDAAVDPGGGLATNGVRGGSGEAVTPEPQVASGSAFQGGDSPDHHPLSSGELLGEDDDPPANDRGWRNEASTLPVILVPPRVTLHRTRVLTALLLGVVVVVLGLALGTYGISRTRTKQAGETAAKRRPELFLLKLTAGSALPAKVRIPDGGTAHLSVGQERMVLAARRRGETLHLEMREARPGQPPKVFAVLELRPGGRAAFGSPVRLTVEWVPVSGGTARAPEPPLPPA